MPPSTRCAAGWCGFAFESAGPRATLFLRPLAPQLIAKVDKDGSGQVDFDEVRSGEATRRRRSLLWRRVVVLASSPHNHSAHAAPHRSSLR